MGSREYIGIIFPCSLRSTNKLTWDQRGKFLVATQEPLHPAIMMIVIIPITTILRITITNTITITTTLTVANTLKTY